MFRPLLAGLLAAGIVFTAGLPGTTAQDKKDPPKKKERIAIAEPKDAAKDPDFAIQGEYEGTVKEDGKDVKLGAQTVKEDGKDVKLGAQVVANGLGEFTIKFLPGGLPGAGWDGKTSKTTKAVTKDGKVVFPVKTGGPAVGSIANGVITGPSDGGVTVTLKRVDRQSKTLGEKPPEGALVLFGTDGDEKNWNGGKIVKLSDGQYLDVGVKSKEKFGAFKAHFEFRLPWMPNSTGQGRANSGVYLQDRYECQVLDSFGLSGENNECGGIYTQHKPLVNMCYPPLAWQTYDMEFTPAEFGADGKKTKNGRATIYHNGVKIHDNIEFPKECPGGAKEEAMPGPFQLQNHGDPVVYRNIWVVKVK